MLKTNFDDVRRAPRERASVFVPEVLLVRSLKPEIEESKGTTRFTDDTFRDAVTKILSTVDDQSVERMMGLIHQLRHPDDMDPNILVVAALMKVRYPGGLHFTSAHQEGTLSAAVMHSNDMSNLVKEIIELSDSKTPNIADAIKADIITYYYLL